MIIYYMCMRNIMIKMVFISNSKNRSTAVTLQTFRGAEEITSYGNILRAVSAVAGHCPGVNIKRHGKKKIRNGFLGQIIVIIMTE